MSSFYWYDLETFGISPQFDRIAQFAGIRTDLNLNPISEPDMFYCQPGFDMLADPEACLITGITPQDCQQKGMLEKDFMERINDLFTEPQTCVVGYNSMRFDDEFMRYGFYRNLMDPYVREWANGNSRWDVIDLVRACYALRPEGIQWAFHEAGKPSFKLTDLTEANHMTHEAAHDALSDVEATIQVAKLIKQKQPKLFDYYLKLRNKNTVKALLNWQILKPIIHVSNKIPAERGCLAMMLPLAVHPTNPNGVICYDLSINPEPLFELDVEDIRDRIFTPQNELPEEVERIPLKTIHINKSPFVAPLSVLKEVILDRIQLDYAANKKHFEQFKLQEHLINKVQEVFNQKYEDDNKDVDALLYSGFFSAQDKELFTFIRQSSFKDIMQANLHSKDARTEKLISRYLARNYTDLLSVDQNNDWHKDTKQKLQDRFGENFQFWFDKLNLLKEQELNTVQISILDDLEVYTKDKVLKLT